MLKYCLLDDYEIPDSTMGMDDDVPIIHKWHPILFYGDRMLEPEECWLQRNSFKLAIDPFMSYLDMPPTNWVFI